MPGEAMKVGPWPRGLNEKLSPVNIKEDELSECTNFDVMNDGTLKSRRAWKSIPLPADRQNPYIIGTWAGKYTLVQLEGISTNTRHLYYVNNPATGYVVLSGAPSTANYYKAVYEREGYLYIVHTTGTIRAQLVNDLPFLSFGTVVGHIGAGATANESQPYVFTFKERVFIVDGGTVYYSKATDNTVWTAPDGGFFSIGPDAYINATYVASDQIIFFDSTKTYVFNFSSDPALDGSVRVLSSIKGARSIATYKGAIFTADSEGVHQFIGNSFQNISQNLVVDFASYGDVKISVVGETLLLSLIGDADTSYYSPPLFYAMNLNTGAWSKYTFKSYLGGVSNNSPLADGPTQDIVGHKYSTGVGAPSIAVVLSTTVTNLTFSRMLIYSFLDYPNTDRRDEYGGGVWYPPYLFKTKEYDLDNYGTWKRLYFWIINFTKGGARIAEVHLVLNGGNLPVVTAKADRQVSISTRFRSLAFRFTTPEYSVAQVGAQDAPEIKDIIAYVGAKDVIRT